MTFSRRDALVFVPGAMVAATPALALKGGGSLADDIDILIAQQIRDGIKRHGGVA
jgi:hypothetical protein